MINSITIILAAIIIFLILALFYLYREGAKVTNRYNELRKKYYNTLDELDANSEEMYSQQQSIESINVLMNSNEDRFRVITEQSLMGVLIIQDNKIVFVNKAAADIVGYPLHEVEKWYVSDFFRVIHPDYVDLVLEQAEKKQRGDTDVIPHYEWKVINKSGEARWVESFSKTISYEGGLGDLITVLDVNDRKKAEKKLVYSETRFRKLFDNSTDAIFIFNYDGVISDANKMAQVLLGYNLDELIGSNVDNYVAGDHFAKAHDEYVKNFKKGTLRFETILITKDNINLNVDVSSKLIDDREKVIQANVRDMTEYVKTLEHMIHAERMGIIGNLASGMAHEINNPLGIILQGIELLELRLSSENKKNIEVSESFNLNIDLMNKYLHERKVFEYIDGIKEAGNRAAQIVSDVMKFALEGNVSHESSPLKSAIDKTINMAKHDYEMRKKFYITKVELKNSLDENLPQIRCSDADLSQIILNLIKNSLQSFNKKSVGNENNSIEFVGNIKDEGIEISIIDNGAGIDSNDINYVFDPFFTTHPLVDSVGLGLYIVYFLVTSKYEGKVNIESYGGIGTKVHLWFPVK